MKYMLMWVPQSGLFYTNGNFYSGDGVQVQGWSRNKIPIFATHSRAETAKRRIIDKYPHARGEFVILGVEVEERD